MDWRSSLAKERTEAVRFTQFIRFSSVIVARSFDEIAGLSAAPTNCILSCHSVGERETTTGAPYLRLFQNYECSLAEEHHSPSQLISCIRKPQGLYARAVKLEVRMMYAAVQRPSVIMAWLTGHLQSMVVVF